MFSWTEERIHHALRPKIRKTKSCVWPVHAMQLAIILQFSRGSYNFCVVIFHHTRKQNEVSTCNIASMIARWLNRKKPQWKQIKREKWRKIHEKWIWKINMCDSNGREWEHLVLFACLKCDLIWCSPAGRMFGWRTHRHVRTAATIVPSTWLVSNIFNNTFPHRLFLFHRIWPRKKMKLHAISIVQTSENCLLLTWMQTILNYFFFSHAALLFGFCIGVCRRTYSQCYINQRKKRISITQQKIKIAFFHSSVFLQKCRMKNCVCWNEAVNLLRRWGEISTQEHVLLTGSDFCVPSQNPILNVPLISTLRFIVVRWGATRATNRFTDFP